MSLVARVVIDEDTVLRPQSCDVALALLNVMLPENAMQVFTQQRFDCSCHAVPSHWCGFSRHCTRSTCRRRLAHQRERVQMLWGRGIAGRAAPTLPAIIGTMHAALIRGPQLAAHHAGA